MSEELTKIYITKYALTRGFEVVRANVGGNGRAWCPSLHCGFADTEYALTPEDAMLRAEELRRRAIVNLNKRIKKLERIEFEFKE